MAVKKRTTKRRKAAPKKSVRRTRRAPPVAAPKKRSTRRRPAVKAVARRRKSSGKSVVKTDIKSMLINVAVGVAGAAAVSFALGHMPKKADGSSVIPANIAPFAPIVIGAAMAILLGKKNKMIASAGTGAMIAGSLSLVKNHFPQLGLGDDQLLQTPEQVRAALLGMDVQGVDLSDDAEFTPDMNGNVDLLGNNEDDNLEGEEVELSNLEGDDFGDDEDAYSMSGM